MPFDFLAKLIKIKSLLWVESNLTHKGIVAYIVITNYRKCRRRM